MKFSVTSKGTDFIDRDKIEKLIEEWTEHNIRPRAKLHGFTDKELSVVISRQNDDEGSFFVRLHMHIPTNTILVAHGVANQLHPAIEKALQTLLNRYENHIERMLHQDANKRQSRKARLENLRDHHNTQSTELFTEATKAIEPLLPKLKSAIKRELTFLRSQGDLPNSYPANQDILDEVVATAISDWEPGINSKSAYLRLLKEMNKVLNREVGASHAYGDIVSLETLAPKDPIEQAESMVDEEFYEFYQPDELLKIEDMIADEKPLVPLANGQYDQQISYLLRLIKELPIKWRRTFLLHELENIPENELAALMNVDAKKIKEWIDSTKNYLNARLEDAGFQTGIGNMLSDLRSSDEF